MNWYYVLNGQQTGPVTEVQLDELARAGTIKADTLVWAEGMANWLPYSQARNVGSPGQPPVIAPTATAFPTTPTSSVDDARRMVQGPGMGFIVMGAICGLFGIYNLMKVVFAGAAVRAEMDKAMSQMPPEAAQFADVIRSGMEFSYGPFGIALGVLGLASSVLMLVAGIRMRKLQSYGLAMAASIIAIIGCLYGCCCIATIPIGIWSVVVLMKPEVKAAFD